MWVVEGLKRARLALEVKDMQAITSERHVLRLKGPLKFRTASESAATDESQVTP